VDLVGRRQRAPAAAGRWSAALLAGRHGGVERAQRDFRLALQLRDLRLQGGPRLLVGRAAAAGDREPLLGGAELAVDAIPLGHLSTGWLHFKLQSCIDCSDEDTSGSRPAEHPSARRASVLRTFSARSYVLSSRGTRLREFVTHPGFVADTLLAVGRMEHVDDLVADLDQAVANA
jgi:hypothetical protein